MSKYYVVFESNDGRITKRRFFSYESWENFDKLCVPDIPERLGVVVAEGVTREEAVELCREVKPIPYDATTCKRLRGQNHKVRRNICLENIVN